MVITFDDSGFKYREGNDPTLRIYIPGLDQTDRRQFPQKSILLLGNCF